MVNDIIWARSCENVSYAICKQQRCRSACASAQSDQHLYCSLLKRYYMYTCYTQSFKILASFCNVFIRCHLAGLNLTLSKIPDDTFSCDVAHMIQCTLLTLIIRITIVVPSTTGKTSLSTSKSLVSSRSTLRTIPPDIATKFTTRPPSSTKQLIPTTKSGPQCPPQIPRSRFHIEFGQHCYEFILRVHKTWPDAERDCKSKGGYLVTISSKAEQDFIYNSVRVSHTTH